MIRGPLRIVLLAAAAIACTVAAAAQLTGTQAPDFVLKSVGGENLRLSEYRGEVVVLNFWASWCGRCRSELEALDDLDERYREAGLAMLGVNLDSERSRAAEAVQAAGIGFPVLHDSAGRVGELYQVDALPAIVLIDRYGVVREMFEGDLRGTEAVYLERLRALLRE